ncbi:hypothetical protein KXW98_000069 [Aspergillus fumigatus]|uniref:Uncharacterized protein n=1 Tax=Aspergillus fumigatus TaxID=746128 RepID=A0A229YD30_ASPFM|nr:hypothetical protein KXX45_000309 [Aspergillus fumigatus]KMK55217.1 hypothetical protein Y699_07322 [Aspergillus fumigatus Z5]KAH1297684.1 hypothetical protein KXX48_007171 [Aspergillus fumigatus]KAH1299407.1 hypothetical protein KXX30_000121 [Aspergillus fumigatus]KAH1302149.1 hypothetical protein KXX11_003210 [Aspergillus fumigatus]
MGAVVSCIQGVFRSIGACLMGIVNTIGAVLKAIINGVDEVFETSTIKGLIAAPARLDEL